MKKISVIALLMSFLLGGCAGLNEMLGLPVNKGNGYSIKHTKEIYSGGVHIEYQDHDFLVEEIKKKMANRMAPLEDTQNAIFNAPIGGRIFVHYEQLTIGAANTKWLEYVIKRDGQEVYRKMGNNRIANVPTDSSAAVRFWWNTDGFDITTYLGDEFEVYVISHLAGKKDHFKVIKKSKEKT
mgnify:CR=1 FL=1